MIETSDVKKSDLVENKSSKRSMIAFITVFLILVVAGVTTGVILGTKDKKEENQETQDEVT